MKKHLRSLWLPLVLLAWAPGEVLAERSDGAVAEAVFAKARALAERRDFAKACPLFEESYRLDPAPGTLLNLANCHRETGEVALSWSEFLEAERVFRRKGEANRAAFAAREAKATEPRVGWLTFRGQAAPGLHFRRERGAELSSVVTDIKMPVDPGKQTWTATAPGKVPAEITFEVGAGRSVEVTLPELKDLPPEPVPVVAERPAQAENDGGSNGQAIAGFTLLGVGGGGLIAGAVFAGLTADKSAAVELACPSFRCATQEGKDALSEANLFANLANGLLIGGGVLGGVGLIVALTAPSSEPTEPAKDVSQVRASIAIGPASIRVDGSF